MNPDILKCCDDERWLPIPNYEGRYIVSTCGRMLSLSRPVPSKHGTTYDVPTRLLSGVVDNAGYRMMTLCDGHSKWRIALHRLVLLTFAGPCPDHMETCHDDGKKQNNHLANLRWDTPQANRKDQTRHGTAQMGEKHGRSPLTNNDVFKIRELGSQGISQRTIAKQFGISQAAISKIIRRESWSHI